MASDAVPSSLVLNPPKRLDVKDYELLRVLGEGSFGRVKLTKDVNTKKFFAFKQLKKYEVIKSKQVDHLKNEIFILSNLKHPFIVNMEGIAQDHRFIYIGLEYVAGGELFTYLRGQGKFRLSQAAFYGAQITSIFEYLHTFNVIYRDLKPENLLINQDGYLKLTDFGFAKIVEDRTYTLCGTPEYLAPEVLTNKGHGKGVDWWTLGILLYEMIVGIDPFNDDDPMAIYKNILNGALKFPKHFDPGAKSIIRHLLESDLSKRYGNLKNGAKDVKNHRFFEVIKWISLVNKSIAAPYVPTIKSANDTSNFGLYASSDDFLVAPVKEKEDPFLSW